MQNLVLSQLTESDIKNAVNEAFQSNVENLLRTINLKEKEELLSRKQTAIFFGISLPTLHTWINKGLVSPFKMGNRTFFLKSQLLESLLNSNKDVA